MSEYIATIIWQRDGAVFTDDRYSRGHVWQFDGGVSVPASASPHVVRLPHSVEAAVDPEEAFVAALSSCHMLTFLWVAAKRGFVVDSYRDEAIGVMGKTAEGKIGVTRVTLRPAVTFATRATGVADSGASMPTRAELDEMHHEAHEQCFIASSVKTNVRCEPVEMRA
jgi:organic hydroperoxide reductase OsmC/OhrA